MKLTGWDYLCASFASEWSNYLEYDSQLGGCRGSGDSYEEDIIFFPELAYYSNVEERISEKELYHTMSADAKLIINFILYGDRKILMKKCSTPKAGKISKRHIHKFYESKWGKRRTDRAVKEIKEYLKKI